MNKRIVAIAALFLVLSLEAPGGLAYSILDAGYKSYDTSLEITKGFNDYLVIISQDGINWEYLQESDGISCGRHFASLALNGSNRNFYFSLAKKLPVHYLAKNIIGIKPLASPAARLIKARATNFLTLAFENIGSAGEINAASLSFGSIKFRLLNDGDEDGLPDINEYEKHGAWPGLYDTDSDGLSDGEEVALGLLPYMADSDGDGIADSSDPHPLVPEYELSYSAWLAYWNAVVTKFQVSGNRLTKANFNNKINPFFDHKGVTIKFSPENITLTNGSSQTNVIEVSFLSGGVVTGLFCASECFGLDYELFQFLPEGKFPAAPEGTVGLPFLARPGETLRFKLISDKEWEEEGHVAIKTASGILAPDLPVNYRNALAPRPALMTPLEGAELSSPFAFSWSSDDNTVTNYILTVAGPIFYEHSLPGTSLTFFPEEKGRYFWQVTSQGGPGQISSETRSFFVLDSDDAKDSDGDGFPDNDELREGYDPFDKSDIPMRLAADFPVSGEKGLFFFSQLHVSGGAKPLFWEMESSPANGLSVNRNGMLFGIPLKSGSFTFSFSVKDQLGRVLDFSLPVEINEKQDLDIQPGFGGFLVQ